MCGLHDKQSAYWTKHEQITALPTPRGWSKPADPGGGSARKISKFVFMHRCSAVTLLALQGRVNSDRIKMLLQMKTGSGLSEKINKCNSVQMLARCSSHSAPQPSGSMNEHIQTRRNRVWQILWHCQEASVSLSVNLLSLTLLLLVYYISQNPFHPMPDPFEGSISLRIRSDDESQLLNSITSAFQKTRAGVCQIIQLFNISVHELHTPNFKISTTRQLRRWRFQPSSRGLSLNPPATVMF